MKTHDRPKRALPVWIWVTLLTTLLILVGGFLSYQHWDWLTSPLESGSTTIRNIALVLAGFLALILALWRGATGERQAAAAEQAVLDGRYQRGIEMLASDTLSARLGGISSLRNLAESQPEQYHIQIMRVFCAFVRHPPPYDSEEAERDSGRAEAEANPREHVHGRPRARADVQAVMDAIGSRGESGIAIERGTGFVIDLNGADLSWVYLEKADLSNADLTFTNLHRAVFYEWRRGSPPPRSTFYLKLRKQNLRQLKLWKLTLWKTNAGMERPPPDNYANEKGWRQMYTANLSGADLSYANLLNARMEHVNLSEAQIREATLSGIWLGFANLHGANLFESDLSSNDWGVTNLGGADLTDASLAGSNCSTVLMRGAILHGTSFSNAKLWATTLSSAKLTDNGQHPSVGLTQEQLDQSITPREGNRPDLNGIVDAKTGEQLVWREAIPHDEKLRRAGLEEQLSEEDTEDGGEEEGGDNMEEEKAHQSRP